MDITYPFDELTEKQVLNMAIYADNPLVVDTVMAMLSAESFHDITHRKMFDVMSELYADKKSFDTSVLQAKLGDKLNVIDYFDDLKGYDWRLQDKIKVLRDLQSRRDLIKLGETVIIKCTEELAPEPVISLIEDDILRIELNRIEKKYREMPEIVAQALEKFRDIKDGKKDKVISYTFGLADMPFELCPGRVYCVAGRPGHGKSTLASMIMKFISIKYDMAVLYISLEETEDMLGERLLLNQSGVPQVLHDTHWDEVERGAKELSSCKMILLTCPTLNISELKAKSRHFHHVKGCKAIAIDYLQLMDGYPHKAYRDNEVLRISDITRSLKSLALDLNVPIIAVSQLSRANETRAVKKPRLSDLRGSGSIEQDSDVVCFCYREECYTPGDLNTVGQIEIITAKHRNGKTGTHMYKFNGDTYRIIAVEKQENYVEKDDTPF